MTRATKFGAFALMLSAAMSGALFAGTTGSISGTVTDGKDKQNLPGVTVTIASPDLIGGARTAVSAADGTYQFAALPPGKYTVKFELQGFTTRDQDDVQVRLDRNVAINAEMSQDQLAETITVSGEAPVVDATQVTQGQVFSQEYLQNVAIGSAGRDYLSVIGRTAGVVGTGNVNVFGSTEGENAYYIDGIDTTDPVTATFGTNFNFDAIQEISFQTAGYEAEYGRATGGVVNLITKSGGNKFSGTFDMRYSDNSFQQGGDHFDKNATTTKFEQPSATLGGPILHDKLWFFASAENIDSQSTPTDSPTTRKFKGQNYSGKLTMAVNPSWNAVLKGSRDPATIDNDDADQFISPEATTQQKQGGSIYQGELTGSLGVNTLLNGIIGINRQSLDAQPQSGNLDLPAIFDDTFGTTTNNSPNAQFSDRNRDEYGVDVTQFVTNLGGDHEFKGGVSYDKLSFKTQNFTTGDAEYIDRAGHIRELDVTPRQAPFNFDGKMQTAFLQDAWHPLPNLTLKLGARYDKVAFDNDVKEVANYNKVQPRLGFAWDAASDGKTVVRGSFGRFMHPSALSLPSGLRSTTSALSQYFSCSRYGNTTIAECEDFAVAVGGEPVVIQDPLHRDPVGFWLAGTFGSSPSQVQSNLKPTYADTLTLAVERQVAERTSVELSYVNKKTKDIFEDTCDGNFPTPGASDSCDFYVYANIPGLKREYEGVMLTVHSRAKSWFELTGSYTYAKSRGNIEYTQNAGSDFDVFPVHFENRFGYLSDDRRQRVKVDGFVRLPLDFNISASAFWSSAFAYSVTQAADPYGTQYLEPRGDRRANSNYQLDLQVAKGFQIGPVRAQLIAAAFNVLDTERVTGVCESVDGACGGDIPLGGPTSFQQPRRFEAGVRLAF